MVPAKPLSENRSDSAHALKGQISVLGHDARDEPLEIRNKIAVVPQEGGTIGPLTPWTTSTSHSWPEA